MSIFSKTKKTSPKTPRKLQDINTDYNQRCLRAGELQFNMKKPDMFVKVVIAHPVMKFNNGALQDLLILTNFNFLKWIQVNPVNVIKTVPKMPMTYVTTCKADTMVATDAAQEFYKRGKAKGFDFTLHIDKVGCAHGAFDSAPAIAWMAK